MPNDFLGKDEAAIAWRSPKEGGENVPIFKEDMTAALRDEIDAAIDAAIEASGDLSEGEMFDTSGWALERLAEIVVEAQVVPEAEGREDNEGLGLGDPRTGPKLEWFPDLVPSLGGGYLVKGLLDAGTLSVCYGQSNSGKTFFVLDIAYCIAAGVRWRGKWVSQAPVLYLAAEGGNGIKNRLVALRDHPAPPDITAGWFSDAPASPDPRPHAEDVHFALRRGGLDLFANDGDVERVIGWAREAQARLPGRGVFIVVDTLARVFGGGDENSAGDMGVVVKGLDRVREETDASIMIVHHSGKDTTKGARGSGSLRAAVDTEIEVIEEGKGPRHAVIRKQRDLGGVLDKYYFHLEPVILGHDPDGDEVSTCVTRAMDNPYADGDEKKKPLPGNQGIIDTAYRQLLADGRGEPNPAGIGWPEAGRFLTVARDDLRKLAEGKIEAKDPGNSYRASFKLLSGPNGVYAINEGRVWRTDDVGRAPRNRG